MFQIIDKRNIMNTTKKFTKDVVIQSNEFTETLVSINNKKKILYSLLESKRLIEADIKQTTNKLYSLCKHEYIREATSDSCYREYINVCKHCGRIN